MKAVMLDVPAHILEWRRRTGASRRDEVWDGVLHMAPEAGIGHQDLALALLVWLRTRWSLERGRRVLPSVNVSRPGIPDWTKDYRVPDAVLLTPAAAAIEHDEHLEGGPDVVVEVRSPGDESYDKLPFYAAIGCRETWIVDRDSRACEIYAFDGGEVRRRGADADGWTASCVGIELRTEARRLAIRRGAVPVTDRRTERRDHAPIELRFREVRDGTVARPGSDIRGTRPRTDAARRDGKPQRSGQQKVTAIPSVCPGGPNVPDVRGSNVVNVDQGHHEVAAGVTDRPGLFPRLGELAGLLLRRRLEGPGGDPGADGLRDRPAPAAVRRAGAGLRGRA